MATQKIKFYPSAMRHFFLLFLWCNVTYTAVVPADRTMSLFSAIQTGNVKELRHLISIGADVNQANEHGNTPLHEAVGFDKKEMVKILITFHANVNAVDDHGRTPLEYASFGGFDQIIYLLTLSGADVNHRTADGFTPLYMAASRGHVKAVSRLLLNGADANIKCENGKTVKDVAIEKGHTKVVEVLMQYSRAAWKACESYTERYATSIDRVLGGKPAERFEFPWMVALGYLYRDKTIQFDCGGTIVSENFILTAAHCATNRRKPIVVRVGTITLTDGTDHEVQEVIRHPKYSVISKKNDIALIRLKTSINFNNQTFPGCLRTDINDVNPNVSLIVTGFGSISAEQVIRSSVLQKTQLKSLPLAECSATLGEFNARANLSPLRNLIDESQYCAYDPNAKNDSCQGDSGGPLQHFPGGTNMGEILGIVSYGVSCGSELPGLYTKIAYFLDWIESIVWPNVETATPYVFCN